MAKTVRRKKPSLSLIARRVNQFAWQSADDPEAGRLEKVYNAVANRMKAKKEGQKAAVLIAKARKAKSKKAALTAEAKNTHRLANRERDIARASYRGGMDKTLLAAVKAEGKNMIEQGKAKRTTRSTRNTSVRLFLEGKMPHLTGFKISDERGDIARKDEKMYRSASKAAARRSGGTATGIKRTAEAAIGRIATGRALKSMARAGGVLGIAALFASHLSGKTKKGQRS